MLSYRNLKKTLAKLGAKLFTSFCTDSVFKPRELYVFQDSSLVFRAPLIPSHVQFALPGEEREFIGSFLSIFKQELRVNCSQETLSEAIEGTFYPDDSCSHVSREVVEDSIWEIEHSHSGPRRKDHWTYKSVYAMRDGFVKLASMTPEQRLELLGWDCFQTFSSRDGYGKSCFTCSMSQECGKYQPEGEAD